MAIGGGVREAEAQAVKSAPRGAARDAALQAATRGLDGPSRLAAFMALPLAWQEACWQALVNEIEEQRR